MIRSLEEIPQVDDGIQYACKTSDNSCALSCEGLKKCSECGCVVVDLEGGPWGSAMDVILCLLPIIFLLAVTLKPNPLPTTLSLPLSALILLLIRLMYLGSDPMICFGAVILGVHEAMSPLTIMYGAMLLFETMENTLCMPFMLREMKLLTNGHTVAELMIIFSFAYMVEGASGFGTPAALGAPMLASLGYPKFEAVVTLLCMNTFATVWGAVGTPIWFGLGNLGLTESEFIEVSYKSGTAMLLSAYTVLPLLVLSKTCPFRVLRQNIIFIILSIACVMVPAFGISYVSFEFPALIGGMVGCGLNAVLITFKIGMKPISDEDIRRGGRTSRLSISSVATNSVLDKMKKSMTASQIHSVGNSSNVGNSVKAEIPLKDVEVAETILEIPNGEQKVLTEEDKNKMVSFLSEDSTKVTPKDTKEEEEEEDEEEEEPIQSMRAVEELLGERKTGAAYLKDLIGRTFPIWGVVLLLVITRIPQIGLKQILIAKDPAFEIHFGTYGLFRCSASLVLQLNNILTNPGLNWKYELLYIPFIMPFVIVSLITMGLYRDNLQVKPIEIFGSVTSRLINPAKALVGALVLVQLLIKDGPASPSSLIGNNLAAAFKGGWIAIASFVGALGSFFSGSTTISNLTFGEIQQIAAENINTSVTAMLALQNAGASAGNGICLNNIIAACAVVGINVGEGAVIAKTGLPVAGVCIMSVITMLAFYFRF